MVFQNKNLRRNNCNQETSKKTMHKIPFIGKTLVYVESSKPTKDLLQTASGFKRISRYSAEIYGFLIDKKHLFGFVQENYIENLSEENREDTIKAVRLDLEERLREKYPGIEPPIDKIEIYESWH